MATAVPQWRAATDGDTIVDHAGRSLVELAHGMERGRSHAGRASEVARRCCRVPPRLLLTVPLHGDSPVVAASRSLDTVRNFLHVHDLGFAVTTPPEHGDTVLWSDIRYCSASTHGRVRARACALVRRPSIATGAPSDRLFAWEQWQQTRPSRRSASAKPEQMIRKGSARACRRPFHLQAVARKTLAPFIERAERERLTPRTRRQCRHPVAEPAPHGNASRQRHQLREPRMMPPGSSALTADATSAS